MNNYTVEKEYCTCCERSTKIAWAIVISVVLVMLAIAIPLGLMSRDLSIKVISVQADCPTPIDYPSCLANALNSNNLGLPLQIVFKVSNPNIAGGTTKLSNVRVRPLNSTTYLDVLVGQRGTTKNADISAGGTKRLTFLPNAEYSLDQRILIPNSDSAQTAFINAQTPQIKKPYSLKISGFLQSEIGPFPQSVKLNLICHMPGGDLPADPAPLCLPAPEED